MKKIISILLFFFFTQCMVGQNVKTYRQMVENNQVPKSVRIDFKARYPEAFIKMWYATSITYWYDDVGPAYYNGWHEPRKVVVYKLDQPTHYEVEFFNYDQNSRAIFSQTGKWIETRTQITNLPEQIENALQNAEYANWKRSEYKERIESPEIQGSVYRMHLTSKHLSKIIRISDTGRKISISTE